MRYLSIILILFLAACASEDGGFNPVSGPIAAEINRHVDTEGCDKPLTTDKVADMMEPIINSRLRSAGAKADVSIAVTLANCRP